MPTDKPIYLDYHATTPVDPRVAEKVMVAMTTQFGNASSVDHAVGGKYPLLRLTSSVIYWK